MAVDPTIDSNWIAFCGYVASVTGRKVTKARRGTTAQLSEAYISVDLLSADPVTKDLVTPIDANPADETAQLSQRVRGLCIMRFKCTSIAQDSSAVLNRLRNSFWTDVFGSWAGWNGFGLSDVGNVVNISQILENATYENRNELICSFYATAPSTFNIDHFTHFSMEIDGYSPEGDEIKSIEIHPKGWTPPN